MSGWKRERPNSGLVQTTVALRRPDSVGNGLRPVPLPRNATEGVPYSVP